MGRGGCLPGLLLSEGVYGARTVVRQPLEVDVLLFAVKIGVFMSRYMKIAAVGAHRYITGEKKTSQEEVNKALSFLRQKIESVLPDKPD